MTTTSQIVAMTFPLFTAAVLLVTGLAIRRHYGKTESIPVKTTVTLDTDVRRSGASGMAADRISRAEALIDQAKAELEHINLP